MNEKRFLVLAIAGKPRTVGPIHGVKQFARKSKVVLCGVFAFSVCILVSCSTSPSAPIRGLGVNFTPIREGNTWVYQDTSDRMDYCARPHNYVVTLTITRVWQSLGDTTMFSISVRDSGWIDRTRGFVQDTTYTQTGTKTGDTILINGSPSEFFPISQNNISSWDSTTLACCGVTNFGHYFTFQGLVTYKQSTNQCCVGSEIHTFVKMENIGLVFSYQLISNLADTNCGWEDYLMLISFNGKPAPAIPASMGD
jgi:hypothetical protein